MLSPSDAMMIELASVVAESGATFHGAPSTMMLRGKLEPLWPQALFLAENAQLLHDIVQLRSLAWGSRVLLTPAS